MGDELKPCPFCGGEAHVREDYVFGTSWTIECDTDECMGSCGCNFYRDEEKAVNAWNSRTADAEMTDMLNRAAGNWAHADAENRELRELVICMYQTINGMKLKAANADWLPCTDSCPYWESGDCSDLPDDECWYELRMRGLGIEVER